MCEDSTVYTNLNSFLHVALRVSLHLSVFVFFPLFSCISGYSPFTSFPSKAVAANPVSDLSSPLDLGNCLLSFSCSFHTPHALQSLNPLCTYRHYSCCHVLLSAYNRRRSFASINRQLSISANQLLFITKFLYCLEMWTTRLKCEIDVPNSISASAGHIYFLCSYCIFTHILCCYFKVQ